MIRSTGLLIFAMTLGLTAGHANANKQAQQRSDITGAMQAIDTVQARFAVLDEENAYAQVGNLLTTVEKAGGYAVPVLEGHAMGRSKLHARVAVIALGKIDPATATPILRRILAKHPDAKCRALAALSLGNAHCIDAMPDLLALLAPTPTNAAQVELRENIAIALGQMSDRRAIPGLIEVIRRDRSSRAAASVGLAGLAEHLAFRDFAPLVRSKETGLRAAAGLFLGKIPTLESRTALEFLSHDRNYEVRKCAALALGSLGDAAALPALERIVRDSNPDVRTAAELAIAALDGDAKRERMQLRAEWFRALSQPLIQHRFAKSAGKARGSRSTFAGGGSSSAVRPSLPQSTIRVAPARQPQIGYFPPGGCIGDAGGGGSCSPPAGSVPGPVESENGGSENGGSENGSSGSTPASGGSVTDGSRSDSDGGVGRAERDAANRRLDEARSEIAEELERIVEAIQASILK